MLHGLAEVFFSLEDLPEAVVSEVLPPPTLRHHIVERRSFYSRIDQIAHEKPKRPGQNPRSLLKTRKAPKGLAIYLARRSITG